MLRNSRGISSKKAQLTFAIVAGMAIMGIFLIYILITYSHESKMDNPEYIRKQAELYIGECMKYNAETAVYLMGLYGGYTSPKTRETTAKFGQEIVFERKDKVVKAVDEETAKQELSNYIESSMPFCNRVFKSYEKYGYFTETDDFKARISLNEKDTTLLINYPLTISRTGITETMEDFTFKIPVSLKKMINAVQVIANNEDVDITSNKDLAVFIDVLPYEDALVYVLTDYESSLLNEPYKFMFAVS